MQERESERERSKDIAYRLYIVYSLRSGDNKPSQNDDGFASSAAARQVAVASSSLLFGLGNCRLASSEKEDE